MPILIDECGTPVIQLGHGDVLMAAAATQDGERLNEFLFMESEKPVPIGERSNHMKDVTTSQVNSVRLAVDNPESLQVLIEGLTMFRLWLIEQQEACNRG